MSKGNVSLVDGQNRKGVECGGLPDLKGKVTGCVAEIGTHPSAVGKQTPDAFETTMPDGTVVGWAEAEGIPSVAIGTPYSHMDTLVITGCKSFTAKADWGEAVLDLEKEALDKIDAIIINGHKFVREKEL